ncbi:MAG: lipopolysaccharide heptosyltransferase I, partial [Gammaproteobacteria bacterium]
IIHTLPALTDAGRAIPGMTFDWVVENTFAEIPRWHPLVGEVIPIALRQWRKGLFSRETRLEWQQLRQRLQAQQYDVILDAQGLVKSAFLTYFAKGLRVGLDFKSARESLASFAYQRKCTVNFYQHAIVRMRRLFSQALGYTLPETAPDFDLTRLPLSPAPAEHYLVFLHGTTWETKLWPEAYWIQLAKLAEQAGYRVKLSSGNVEEMERAQRIARACTVVDALPRLALSDMASLLTNAKAVVAVDTGFGHLAAALNVPTVSLYGPTNPEYTGALGKTSIHLAAQFPCSPCMKRICTYREPSAVTPACYETLPPAYVWEQVKRLINPTIHNY